MLLSVIIPVYNVERYLERCLESIFAQWDKEHIELICINDGSTDKSYSILMEYSNVHPELRLVNQSNIGLGATRNKAVQLAIGKYLMFVDSDDYLEPDCLKKILVSASELSSDFVEFESLVKDEKGQLVRKFNILSEELTDLSLDNYLDRNNKLLVTAWCKIWNRKFIRKNNIKFEENTRWEDIEFSQLAYEMAETVSSRKIEVYNYFLSDDSISRAKVSDEFLSQFLAQRIRKNRLWMQTTKSRNIMDLLKPELYKAKRRFMLNIISGLKSRTISWKGLVYLLRQP